MKRIYKKRKSSEIKQKALEQFRETRAFIEAQHPELLDELCNIIERVNEKEQLAASKTAKQKTTASEDPMVKVDRQKNLETILRFVELKPHSDGLKQELKKLLT